MAVKRHIDISDEGLRFLFGQYLAEFVKETNLDLTEKEKIRCLELIEQFAVMLAAFVHNILQQVEGK